MIVKVITTDLGKHFAWVEESSTPEHVLTYSTSRLFAPWYGMYMDIELWRNEAVIDRTYVAEYGTHAPIFGFRKFDFLKHVNAMTIVEWLSAKDFEVGDELRFIPPAKKKPRPHFERYLWFGMLTQSAAEPLYLPD